MLSYYDNSQSDLLNIYNPYFEEMVGQIFSTKFELNKANYL